MQCGTQSRSSQSLKEAVELRPQRQARQDPVRHRHVLQAAARASASSTSRSQIPEHDRLRPVVRPGRRRTISIAPKLHYDWHWDFNTGNGDMGNQGIHQMDIARWFLGEHELCAARDQHRRPARLRRRRQHAQHAGRATSTIRDAPLIFETRGLPRSKAAQERWGDSMDSYRGSRIGVIVQCEKRLRARAELRRGVRLRQRRQARSSAGDVDGRRARRPHQDNWLAAVAAQRSIAAQCRHPGRPPFELTLPPGRHLAPARQAGPRRRDRRADQADELLSTSFDRMASHLRANGVDIDREPGRSRSALAGTRSHDRTVHRQRRRRHRPPPAKTTRALRRAGSRRNTVAKTG